MSQIFNTFRNKIFILQKTAHNDETIRSFADLLAVINTQEKYYNLLPDEHKEKVLEIIKSMIACKVDYIIYKHNINSR